MTHCGSCQHIVIGEYPKHEREGIYRCKLSGNFDTLTKAKECSKWEQVGDLEGRRELVRKLTKGV